MRPPQEPMAVITVTWICSFALSPAAAAGSKGDLWVARRRSRFDTLTTNG